MMPKSGYRFSENICSNKNLKRDGASTKSHPAFAVRRSRCRLGDGSWSWSAAMQRAAMADIVTLAGISGQLVTALPQPAYESSQHVGIVIGPDALSGIGRQDRPKFRLGKRPEVLILARHRRDDGDPLLLGCIFLNVAAVIEARDRAVCVGDAGNDGA